MPKCSKKLKNPVTFRLVHEGDKKVLVPVSGDASQLGLEEEEVEKRKPDISTSLEEDCYFPPDGYNYDQHLRTVNTSKVFSANLAEEKKVEKFSAEIAQVQEALENSDYESDDEEYFDQLETANTKVDKEKLLWGDVEPTSDFFLPRRAFSEISSDLESYEGESVDEEEFEEMLESYADFGPGEDISECDSENDERAQRLIAKSEKSVTLKDFDFESKAEQQQVKQISLTLLELGSDEPTGFFFERKKKNKWDCETVLSQRTNTSNHPGKIARPASVKRPNTANQPKLIPAPLITVAEELTMDESSSEESCSVVVEPRKGLEDMNEKERYLHVKETQRLRRQLKKEMKVQAIQKSCQRKLQTAGNGDVPSGAARIKL